MVVVVATVVVVADDVVVVGLGLVVVGTVVGGALGCGRVGSGDEVGSGTPLDRDVELRVAPPVATSVRLPVRAVGRPLGSVVVGPATPTLDSTVSGPTPTV